MYNGGINMHKIEVRHTCIVINDYTLGDAPNLERFFSIYDKLRHTYFPKGRYYDEENKRLYLPRGIDAFFVEKAIGVKAYLEKKADSYRMLGPIMIKYGPRDDVQKEAIRFLLAHNEYSYTRVKSQLSLNLNPGAGKTYISVVTMAYERVMTMMITSSLGWIEQWKKEILHYTDIQKDEIFIIAGVGTIARILNGMVDLGKIKFILASHDTIKSYGDKYGWDKVSELFKFIGVGLKIYDEAHLNFDNICMIDFFSNTIKTIYLTATPARSEERENLIYQTSFKNVPAIDLFNEDKDPRTAYISMNYNSHPTAFDINNCKNNAYGLDRNKYVNYVVTKPEFYKLIYIIMELVKKKKGPDFKILIYIGVNSAINIVYKWMDYYFSEYRGQIGIYNSLVPKDIKKEQLNKKIILSTTKSCGAAIDIKGLMSTIVLAEPFKSEILARQSLGRTRDEDTYYIEAVDRGFKAIKGYYRAKQPVFDKYATSCTDVFLSDKDLNEQYTRIIDKKQRTFEEYIRNYKETHDMIKIAERMK
jgi:hypothetical protein